MAHSVESASTTSGLPIAPSLGPALETALIPFERSAIDRRVVIIAALCVALGGVAGLVAQVLVHLISLITNIAFFHRISVELVSPANAHVGLWVLLIPVVGGVLVGFMARYGSKAIRGHGIPEAMEQVLTNESRIPARMTFLKPLSAAVAIGTGGPFGAEGPIIATGGAIGSFVGQIIHTSSNERKTLLAAGAAAGMAATFGAPVSAVLLAVELLLFEFRPQSLIPVALAASMAAAVRIAFEGSHPVFPMPDLAQPTGIAMAGYIVVGIILGLLSVFVTKAVYWVEDAFEHLPVHWMWWPAIGSIAVGVCGYFEPRTLGVGYSNITQIISADFGTSFVIWLVLMKFASWSIALGSGTSGGTLAPMFTIGGGCGFLLGVTLNRLFPGMGVDPRIAALVGMAALFAGASRALLASVVFAFETTRQPLGLLPLLGGCSAAYLIAALLMRTTIMTEKIARRGIRVPQEYAADFLDQILVRSVASKGVISFKAGQTLAEVRAALATGRPEMTHQGFPILDASEHVMGVLTRRTLLDPAYAPTLSLAELIRRPPVLVYADCSLRVAADHMVRHNIGRLPVLDRTTRLLVGFITRSDLLGAHRARLD
jgi:H+/Cl- antiporter ClcA/CBS domain-containing protein